MPYISLLDTKKKTVNVYLLLQFHSLLILFAMLFSLFTEKKSLEHEHLHETETDQLVLLYSLLFERDDP